VLLLALTAPLACGRAEPERSAAGPAPASSKAASGPSSTSAELPLPPRGAVEVSFGADAHAPVLLRSLARVSGGAPVKLNAFKVSHHGSTHNVNHDLLKSIRCRNYLISTNGKKFKHPSTEAIARIIKFGGGTLHFNYRTEFNEMWDDKALKKKHKYATKYPAKEGIALNLD